MVIKGRTNDNNMLVLQGRPIRQRRCAVLLRQVIQACQHLRNDAALHLPLRALALCSDGVDLVCNIISVLIC